MELHEAQREPEAPPAPEPAAPESAAAKPVVSTAIEDASAADGAAPIRPSARHRGRTAVLLAVAAVIGVSAGTAVGYQVQADRPPTPLPALNQPGLAYPAEPLPGDKVPEPLSAAEDRGVKTDGDLRKLLLATPKAARTLVPWGAVDGWPDTAAYSRQFDRPAGAFAHFTEEDLRRIAAVAWMQGENKETNIGLVQFRSGKAAMDHAKAQQGHMLDAGSAGDDGDPLKGSGNGRYYLYPVERKAGFMPRYRAQAIFQRGDIMVDINIIDTKRISKNEIRSLAERQLERLS
ncbi:hypothetical protein [Streptomyces sp. NBC_01750]|uniref:hypothetical protein n=1 Tax=Streptomyces sp. NBC_01750 TaxID=2975928 RepID=UPI002DD85293|nr:hypothetical protein [Streptomyces sp. NBC_01750]WSD30705.1 hypothetical protein OG966_01150 [Streptomyces sp. NBC_01750]